MGPCVYLAIFEWCLFISGVSCVVLSDEIKFQLDNPEYSGQTPRILSSPSQLSVLEGDTVVFPCRVDNPGNLVLMWKRGKSKILFSGQLPADSNRKFGIVDQTSLQIESVTAEYAGEYTCFINGQPEIALTHVLQVLIPPKITLDKGNDHIIIKRGDAISAKCNAQGYPLPIVTWKALKGTLPGGVTTKQGNILSIPSAETYHSGIYECKADNGVGRPDTAIVRIKVLYAPELTVTPLWVHAGLGSNVEFKCLATAEPSAILFWTKSSGTILTENENIVLQHAQRSLSEDMLLLKIRRTSLENFGSYSCFSNNSLGSTFRTVELSGLAEPVKFRGNASGEEEDSFLLSWSVKSYSPIIEYLLRVRQQKSRDSSSQAPPWIEVMIPVEEHQQVFHSLSYNITGLEARTAYEAVMQARNDFGWNHPSETFTFYTLGGERQPDFREDVTYDQISENIIVPGASLQEKDIEKEKIVKSISPKCSSNFNLILVVYFAIRMLEW